MMNTQTNTATEPEVVCNHKPGDVWADGCCTSKKNKQAATAGSFDAHVSADAKAEEQATPLKKD